MLLPSRNIFIPGVTFLYFRIPFSLQAIPLNFDRLALLFVNLSGHRREK